MTTTENPFPLGQPGFVTHPIDRAAHIRTDADKLFALEGDRKARAYVVHRDSLVMTQGADGPRALLTLDEARKLGANPGTIFLGLHEGGAIFGMGIAAAAAEDLMGRPDVSKPVDGEEFELFVKLMAEHPNIWSKLSCPERLSLTGPKALNGEQYAYTDVVPFARRLMQQFPDRVLFGTDWPHPNLKDHMPDDGLLVDYLAQIATTPQELQQILVDNPMRLYWPEEVK